MNEQRMAHDTGMFPVVPNGTLTLGERLERIENEIKNMSERVRNVELRVVYMSAIVSIIVSASMAALGVLITSVIR